MELSIFIFVGGFALGMLASFWAILIVLKIERGQELFELQMCHARKIPRRSKHDALNLDVLSGYREALTRREQDLCEMEETLQCQEAELVQKEARAARMYADFWNKREEEETASKGNGVPDVCEDSDEEGYW